MRIGHFMRGIWEPGGRASYIRRVSEAQRAQGHVVSYFDLHAKRNAAGDARANEIIWVQDATDLFEQAAQHGIEVLHLHTDVELPEQLAVPALRSVHGHEPYCPSGSRYLGAYECPCDRAYSLTGCLWGHLVDKCGSRRPAKILGNFKRYHLERRTLTRIPVAVVSRFLKAQMMRSGYAEGDVHVLYSPAPEPAEPTPFPEAGTPHIVFAGRIVPEKGVGWLLRALARVRVPVHLDVLGVGYAEADMRSLAAQLGLEGKVTFHGWCNDATVQAHMKTAHAVVFPSLWHEPAGLVTLEAAALGRPVIASAVGGIPEYATSDYALLVTPGDVDGLAACIDRFAGEPGLARRYGEAGRKLVANTFTMPSFLQNLERLYELAIRQHAGVHSEPLSTL